MPRRGAPQQRGRGTSAARRRRHRRRAPGARGAHRGVRSRRRGRGPVGGGVRLGGGARSAPRPTRSRWWRTRPARGTWRSTRWRGRSPPAIGSSPSRAEYASNVIGMLQVARRTGAEVVVVPDDESGQLSVDALRDLLDDRVRLVAISWIPTQSGLVNPAAAVGAAGPSGRRALPARRLPGRRAAPGRRRRARAATSCRPPVASTCRAPRGTGFLYVRRSRLAGLEPPFLDVHAARWAPGDAVEVRDDARRFESWEHSVANRLGLGAAVDYALALGADAIAARIESLGDLASRAQLVEIPGLTLHDRGRRAVRHRHVHRRRRRRVRAGGAACGRRASTSRCRPSTSPGTTSRRAASTPSRARRCTTTTPRRSSLGSSAPSRAPAPPSRDRGDAGGRRRR